MNATLIAKINQYIKSNGSGQITGPVLNVVLRDMVNQSVAEVTYASLATVIANAQVTPGTVYKITDRGDRGILVTGVTSQSVSREGVRIMLCPKTYLEETLDGNVWKGVWYTEKMVSVNDLFIWGGKVWKNLTGAIGTKESSGALDSTNWQLISKTSFTHNEYVEVAMSVSFDFANDWIERQWIPGQLAAGLPWSIADGNFPENYVDMTDWNDNSTKYMNVDVLLGVFNNDCGSIVNVSCTGITENYQIQNIQEVRVTQSHYDEGDIPGVITHNRCMAILSVNHVGSISGIDHPDQWYAYHMDDKSFYIQCDFDDDLQDGFFPGPLNQGEHTLLNMVLHQNTVLTEITALGIGLTGEAGSKISIGLEVDDETYLVPTTLAALNTGVKVTVLGNKTTATHRRFKITAVDGDVTGGTLKISGKYL